MFPQMLLALLTDSSGRVLLVRRKDSLLWSLPGSVVRAPITSRTEFLAVCCRRQIGVTPDFVVRPAEFTFAGQSVAIRTDEIPHERARACGRVAESHWCAPDALPVDLAPVARMAIVLHCAREADVSAPAALAMAC